MLSFKIRLVYLSLGILWCSWAWASKGSLDLPDQVYIKTPTESFDLFLQYALREGKIYSKPIDSSEDWRLYEKTGLPHASFPQKKRKFSVPQEIVAISADADHLVAISDESRVYLKTQKSESLGSKNRWMDNWGVPRAPFFLNAPVADPGKNFRAFAMGRRNQWVQYSEDPAGNPHHFGLMGTSTFYVLDESGQEILFMDNGLPQDLSHRVCGPDRGTFIADSISASASTLFVMNDWGESYTKNEDFDLNGGSSPVFNYDFEWSFRPNDRGSDVKTNWHSWALPLEDWRKQPSIPIYGQARLTRMITVLQNGHGNSARELRVAGLGPDGGSGYYSKQIFDSNWKFIPAKIKIPESQFLKKSRVQHPETAPRGPSKDILYSGSLTLQGLRERREWRAQFLDFNLVCSPSRLRIWIRDDKPKDKSKDMHPEKYFDVLIHTTEMWAMFYQRRAPGIDGTPKLMFATLEIPPETESNPDLEVQFALSPLRLMHKKAFQMVVHATKDSLVFSNNSHQPNEVQLQMNFFRKGLDPYPAMEKMPSDTKVFSFFSEEDYLNLANREDLFLQKKSAPQEIEEKVRLNLQMKAFLTENFETEKKILGQRPVMRKFLGVATKALHVLRGEKVSWSPINAFAKRGALFMESYRDTGEVLLDHAESGYEQAIEIINKRVDRYSRLSKRGLALF